MTTLALAQDDERPASQSRPALPVEGHVVSAVRALEAAKQHCGRAYFGDFGTFGTALLQRL